MVPEPQGGLERKARRVVPSVGPLSYSYWPELPSSASTDRAAKLRETPSVINLCKTFDINREYTATARLCAETGTWSWTSWTSRRLYVALSANCCVLRGSRVSIYNSPCAPNATQSSHSHYSGQWTVVSAGSWLEKSKSKTSPPGPRRIAYTVYTFSRSHPIHHIIMCVTTEDSH